jgi:hypothetical protein
MTNTNDYYLGVNGERRGPLTLEQLRNQQITATTPVWKPGFPGWKTAGELPELRDLLGAEPPPLPPPPPPAAPLKGPWNPTTIAWWSVLCTPIWGGILAAINARRLGMATPWYRPLAPALAWIVIDGLCEAWWGEGYFRSLGIYLGCVWALWSSDLEGQAKEFRKTQSSGASEGHWLVPGIAGSPLALLIFLAFLVSPFAPLEPRQVCDRLIHADTPAEFKKYATLKLQPALLAMSKVQEENGDYDYELLGEEDAPAHVGGYLVAYRVALTTKGTTETMEWLFHLITVDDAWRVEDIFLTAFNGRAPEEPISIAANYQQIVQAARLDQFSQRSATGGTKTDWSQVVKKTPFAAWFVGWKALAAIAVGAGAWVASLTKQNATKG